MCLIHIHSMPSSKQPTRSFTLKGNSLPKQDKIEIVHSALSKMRAAPVPLRTNISFDKRKAMIIPCFRKK